MRQPVRRPDGQFAEAPEPEAVEPELASNEPVSGPSPASGYAFTKADAIKGGKVRGRDRQRHHHSHYKLVGKRLPGLLARIASDEAPADLSPLEHVARDFRMSLINDAGGIERITSDRLAMIQTVVGSWIILSTIDVYLLKLAEKDGLVSKKHRRVFNVVSERSRMAESFTRQLLALGIPRTNPADDLHSALLHVNNRTTP
jgi:hypothetical protein